MKTVEILGENRFETWTKTRAGSRAVVVRDGMILLSHEVNSGWWLVPGGGEEKGETPEECCVREVEEETGLIVKPLQQFLTMYEYYAGQLRASTLNIRNDYRRYAEETFAAIKKHVRAAENRRS